MLWRCRDRVFDLTDRTLLMGIVNVTPDSFSDPGRTFEPSAAVARARQMVGEGADLIDLGAESTRPGSAPVPAGQQIRRLKPVLEALSDAPVCLSIDSSSAEVAEMALGLGARVVNDVTALGDPAMAGVVKGAGAGVVLLHMLGTPATMQHDPRYDDVTTEVQTWLADRLATAKAAGIEPDSIAIDPGIGFGKLARHSLELIARLDRIVTLGRPVLIGISRKSFLGGPLDLPVDERLEAGLAATAIAVYHGARIVRTHDVTATRRAVCTGAAIRAARASAS